MAIFLNSHAVIVPHIRIYLVKILILPRSSPFKLVLSRLMKKVERKKKQSKLKGDKTEVKMLTIRPELKKEFKGYSVS